MGKRWRFFPHDSERVRALEQTARIPSVVAQLLICRGIDSSDEAQRFLDVKLGDLRDPGLLPSIDKAVDILHDAVQSKRRIIVYGDYDADGMTATAILVRCLQTLRADVGYYVPNRMEEGYGLNDDALRRLHERGTDVVVTVDCGIASVQPASVARELGIQLIITDHHQRSEQLPDADAIVHPAVPTGGYPFAGLCGAGVAFKLAWAMCQRASGAQKVTPQLREYLLHAIGLAAIGTVADVVPLVDENRVLVRHGLVSLKQRPSVGVAALMALTGLDSKQALGSEDIGFMLAPRLNAAGRLGQAQLGVELLTTESFERAEKLAEYINELNGNRETLERSIYLAANKQVKEHFDADNDPALVLAERGWHPGVIGIVAGRLAERYCRPVVMIALDELGRKIGTGSARSANGLDLHQALAACSSDLVTHGGHAAAAGLRIDEAHVDGFRTHFCEHVATTVSEEDRVTEIHIDAEAPFSQLTLATIQQIEQLAPFGQANPRPVMCAMNVGLAAPPKKMGSGQRHLSLDLKQFEKKIRAVAFGKAEWSEPLQQVGGPIDIAYRPVINEFRGRRSVEMHLVDWRPAEA